MPLITLVPNTGVQFFDVPLDLETLPRVTRTFWEEPVGTASAAPGVVPVMLRELVADADGTLVVRNGTVTPPDEQTYTIGRNGAFEMHLNRWVPLPYLLTRPAGPGLQAQYDRGPANWARACLAVHPNPGPGRTHTVTLAFDTTLAPRGERYTSLSPDNSLRQEELAFVSAIDDIGWFLDEAWVGLWLREMLVELRSEQRRGRPLRPEDLPNACDHYARYLVLLDVLDASNAMPRVRILDTVSPELGYKPVSVDLVLDIGNARTCGILIEEHPDEGLSMADSYPLALRDLSRPELVHARPFDSRVEFSRASFGRDAIARKAGRGSFVWPSPVRVGPEAVRLAGARVGNEGASGLSSPKRYLWDDRPSTQGWRFNGRATDGTTTDPPVNGPFMALVDEEGSVLPKGRLKQPAVRARFSRSSMFTFLLAEILLQALNQVNAPGGRAQRRDADKPRRLRSVLLTMPPGMPVAEQALLRSRAASAVQLVWAMLGWTGQAMPVVKANLDEATATQIVWLHNEVTERLQGDAEALMTMMGRNRPDNPAQNGGPGPAFPASLRIASIDIGGGTTDLMVTTYGLAGETLVPEQEFRESFKIAGDDVLERVIALAVLPPVEAALTRAGVGDAKALLTRALMQNHGGQAEQERQLRRLFMSTVLEPLGVAVLRAYELAERTDGSEILRRTVADILGGDAGGAQRAFEYLEAAAAAAGAPGFRLAEVEIVADGRRVGNLVRSVLDPVLADLCEVVWHYDCDVLLLSGRPSRLRAVMDTVLAKAPVPPHRVVGMHRYQVGDRYPFRDPSNRIDDPKTTAAVGAALCVQAEGRMRNFVLRTRALNMRSTARFIGRMFNGGQITTANELLTNVDLDGPRRDDVQFTLSFSTTTQIGFRQLPIERWTATPLYVMEFGNPDNAQRFELPLQVTVRRREPAGDDDDPVVRELFGVEQIRDAAGDEQHRSSVRLRLQTMHDGEGYWRDTGLLSPA